MKFGVVTSFCLIFFTASILEANYLSFLIQFAESDEESYSNIKRILSNLDEFHFNGEYLTNLLLVDGHYSISPYCLALEKEFMKTAEFLSYAYYELSSGENLSLDRFNKLMLAHGTQPEYQPDKTLVLNADININDKGNHDSNSYEPTTPLRIKFRDCSKKFYGSKRHSTKPYAKYCYNFKISLNPLKR